MVLMMVISACVRPQEKLQKDIESAEKEIAVATDAVPSFERADSLVKMYLNYADQYKDDTLSPVYLFKAGDLCMKTGRYEQAIDLFGKVQRYKGFRQLADALFMQGFLYESQLGDTAKARVLYTQFISKFPNHEFADDAKHLIENLDLTPEQLIRKLETSNPVDSLQAVK